MSNFVNNKNLKPTNNPTELIMEQIVLISNYFRLKITDQGRNLFVKKKYLLEITWLFKGQVRIKLISTSIEFEIETQI